MNTIYSFLTLLIIASVNYGNTFASDDCYYQDDDVYRKVPRNEILEAILRE
jgi:hypothetical protein